MSTESVWVIPIVLAIVGVVLYFLFLDFGNQYLLNLKAKSPSASPKGGAR